MRTGESCTKMFSGYVNAERITFGRALHTKGARKMYAMFNGCGSLRELDLCSFDTSNVTDMFAMFNGCGSLRELDLSNFDTSKVSDMRYMFDNCPAGSKWQHLLH